MIFQKELRNNMLQHGEKNAIEQGQTTMSYSNLLRRADVVTRYLGSFNMEKETIVGIQLENRFDLVAAIIGVLNNRCVFVPVDGTLPEGRLTTILQDLQLNYIICSATSEAIDVFKKQPGLEILNWENIPEKPVNDREDVPGDKDFDENDSIYIYYTSGSTGKPKGIIGRNKSLLQFIQWEIGEFKIDEHFKISQFISPYFDAFLRDVFVPLMSGGTICIPPEDEDFFTPEKMIPWLNDTGIKLVHCVPSIFRTINAGSLSPEMFKELEYVLLSGEKIIPAELRNWYSVFGARIQLVNLYGLTETTMIRSFYKIKPEDTGNARIPIGYPISDTQLLIANKDGKPCNKLVPGELYIVSEYITKGYWNEPELTRERFITLSAGTANEKRAFKTGDTARMLADGRIDLMGREDRQIKIRGIRVEPDETENMMIQSGLVKNGLVIKHTTDNGNESLVAFVIRKEGLPEEKNITGEVQNYLEEQLPAYMVPSNIIEVQEYPLTRNGKINHAELLKKLDARTVEKPANATEEKLLGIWQQMLGEKNISITDSFNRIGGNSLSIMRLIGIIYKEFNVRISLSDMFKNLTIRKQAEWINNSGKDQVMVIPAAGKKAGYHLSAAQERIYFNYEINKNSTAYNLPMAWQITGDLDTQAIEKVLKLLVERHESLRTKFILENGRLIQVVEDMVEISLEEWTVPDIRDAINEFIRPFDLSKAPLIRAAILANADKEQVLVVDTHHIICDGMSQVILRSDFLNLYKGEILTPLPVQYKDYAEWEYRFKSTNEYSAHREFWLNRFDGMLPELNLPTTNGHIKQYTDEGGNLIFKIDKHITARLTDLLIEQEITTSSCLFAIYLLFISQLTGQEDIVIGTTISGRMQEETAEIVGMFVKTLPVRYNVDMEHSFKQLARDVHQYLVQCYHHQAYDLADIVSELGSRKNTAIKSLFEVLFVYQNFEYPAMQTGRTEFSEYKFENNTSKYPLSLIVSEDSRAFYFRVEYASLYFTRADIKLLSEQFTALVKTICDNPDTRIIEYPEESGQATGSVDSNISFNF